MLTKEGILELQRRSDVIKNNTKKNDPEKAIFFQFLECLGTKSCSLYLIP